MKTALKKYSQKRVKAITALLQKPARTYTVATFHGLRVEIKKLSALFELVNDCSKDFKRKKTFKPFKSIFRQAGKVRELQLVEAMLKKYNFQSSLKVYLHDLEQLRLKEQKIFFSIINEKFAAQVKNTCKDLAPFLKKTDKKEVKEYMEKKKKEIETLLDQTTLKAEQVHEVRKRLKQFYYNRKSLAILKQNKQSTETDALPELLGKWHDGQVIMRYLSKAIDANGINPKQASRLKIIKAKLSSDGELLLENIYAALPASKVVTGL